MLFAELQDSTGQLVTNNQVVYPNAFTDCDADVRYTYKRASFEQDIVVQQQLPTPDSFGLNPDTTLLQVWTEINDPPTPAIEPILNGADERLDFGIMKMERGKAFIMGSESNSVPVGKQWTTVQGRTFLIEQVQYDTVEAQLQSLPAYTSGAGGTNGTAMQQIHFQGFPNRLPPAPTLAKRADQSLKLTETRTLEKGLVLDYKLLNGSVTNFTFRGDTTYYIPGNVNLYGTTTIEGGTVVKFTNIVIDTDVQFFGGLNCDTGPYRMAVFTAMDDNTVGQTLPWSSGTPSGYYAGSVIDNEVTGDPVNIDHLRISYAWLGTYYSSSGTNLISNCQFVSNYEPVVSSGTTVSIENGLFVNVGDTVLTATSSTMEAVNVTVDEANVFYNGGYGSTLNLTNSLLVSLISNAKRSPFNLTDSH